MEIDINQSKLSIRDKYKIFIDGSETYFASSKLWRWLAELELFDKTIQQSKVKLQKRWSWFKSSYDITREGNLYEFRTKSYWKNHYQCVVGKDLYDIYGHKGRKISVYKNDFQVAWWSKAAVTWFNGDNYKIIADKDCDRELIISFCLIIDSAASRNNNKNALTIDIGHIGPQAKKFDSNWLPKY